MERKWKENIVVAEQEENDNGKRLRVSGVAIV